MAWWTHLLFLEGHLKDNTNQEPMREEFSLAYFRREFRQYLYQNFIDVLYLVLSVCTYLYLGFSIITFFFEANLPESFPHIIEVLSEPYLGVLGIYVVVKELERKKGKVKQRTWSELFAIIWVTFFITATVLTYYSEHYHIGSVYKTVVTNALAALIIRIGTLIR